MKRASKINLMSLFWMISKFLCCMHDVRAFSIFCGPYLTFRLSNFVLLPRYYVDGPAEYGDFVSLISNQISDRGVFVAQVGEAPALHWPTAEKSVIQNRFKFVNSLRESGFTSVVDYEEVSIGLTYPRSFSISE